MKIKMVMLQLDERRLSEAFLRSLFGLLTKIDHD